jgi:hypothetical protein
MSACVCHCVTFGWDIQGSGFPFSLCVVCVVCVVLGPNCIKSVFLSVLSSLCYFLHYTTHPLDSSTLLCSLYCSLPLSLSLPLSASLYCLSASLYCLSASLPLCLSASLPLCTVLPLCLSLLCGLFFELLCLCFPTHFKNSRVIIMYDQCLQWQPVGAQQHPLFLTLFLAPLFCLCWTITDLEI